jgi:superoxide dismutase, Fe-Mn family
MLQRGDQMSQTSEIYLQELVTWGEQVKSRLQHSDVLEKQILLEQIDNWQAKVVEILQGNKRIEPDQLHSIHEEGERIFHKVKQQDTSIANKSVPYGQHTLPNLPYPYNALEPYISEEIMRLHHDKHHQSYVDGLNKAEKEIYGRNQDDKLIKHWLREQAFHGSGHHLHTIFWFNMTPRSSKQPYGELLKKIEMDFGSWPKFKTLFTNTANSVEGDGWAILYWNPRSGKLGVQSFEKHQLFQIADIIPLLVLDMWEHAYYLQYKTDKKAYINNWWNVVNWKDVNERFKQARKLQWQPY